MSQDNDSFDLYDARVGGGFPEPVTPLPCEGEACQGPLTAPPDFPTPGSATFNGPGNVKEKPKTCPKGKHKVKKNGKSRCVKKKKQQKHKLAKPKRGVGR